MSFVPEISEMIALNQNFVQNQAEILTDEQTELLVSVRKIYKNWEDDYVLEKKKPQLQLRLKSKSSINDSPNINQKV